MITILMRMPPQLGPVVLHAGSRAAADAAAAALRAIAAQDRGIACLAFPMK